MPQCSRPCRCSPSGRDLQAKQHKSCYSRDTSQRATVSNSVGLRITIVGLQMEKCIDNYINIHEDLTVRIPRTVAGDRRYIRISIRAIALANVAA
ncbi:MAG: hypothetical protein AAF704_03155, partial [Cyanobacteria bacterium P01_D01_bin.123]